MRNVLHFQDYSTPGSVINAKLYRGSAPLNVAALPEPIAIIPEASFITVPGGREIVYYDSDIIAGNTYYYRLVIYGYNNSAISEEVIVIAAASNGPGASSLTAGNSSIGLFGEVVSANFLNMLLIRTLAGVSLQYASNDNPTQPDWIKVIDRGKVKFIPKKNLATSISASGRLIDGLVAANSVNDNATTKTILFNKQRYRLRLFNGFPAQTDTSLASYGFYDLEAPLGSNGITNETQLFCQETEWDRIVLSLCTDASSVRTYPIIGTYTFSASIGAAGYGIYVAEKWWANAFAWQYRGTRGRGGSVAKIDAGRGVAPGNDVGAYVPVLEHLPW